jgi:hypothetical protein
MKTLLRPFLLLLCLTTLSLAGCKKDECTKPTPPNTIIGSWKLTNRQCFCAPAPTPNETLTLTATGFSFYSNGQLTASGTYVAATASNWCGGSSVPALRFTYSANGWTPRDVVATLTGTKLVLDYGGCLDAPVDTYQRIP